MADSNGIRDDYDCCQELVNDTAVHFHCVNELAEIQTTTPQPRKICNRRGRPEALCNLSRFAPERSNTMRLSILFRSHKKNEHPPLSTWQDHQQPEDQADMTLRDPLISDV
jgi:hypothetical protein